MTNKELLLQMKEELSSYQIGLHNISLQKYQSLIRFYHERAPEFMFDTLEEIREPVIARQIMQEGLKVLDVAMGLRSTVSFLSPLEESSFDYNYNGCIENVCNVVVAVPSYLYYQGKDYFVGDLRNYVNVGNTYLFNGRLLPVFVYGYYIKEILSTSLDENGFSVYSFSDQLEFFENPLFWSKLTEEERQDTLERLFREKKKAFRLLQIANSGNRLEQLLCSSTSKNVIRQTKEQEKRLSLRV